MWKIKGKGRYNLDNLENSTIIGKYYQIIDNVLNTDIKFINDRWEEIKRIITDAADFIFKGIKNAPNQKWIT